MLLKEEDSYPVDKIIVPIVFGIIFVIGLVGNGLLIYTVLANKSMRTIPNIFLTSLAIGDFFLILVSVPFRAVLYIFDEWWFGEAMCKISEFMITLSLGTSIFTLTALAGDRFVAIVLPMSALGWSTMRKTVRIAGLIWIFSLILAAPDLITSTVLEFPTTRLFKYQCTLLFDLRKRRRLGIQLVLHVSTHVPFCHVFRHTSPRHRYDVYIDRQTAPAEITRSR